MLFPVLLDFTLLLVVPPLFGAVHPAGDFTLTPRAGQGLGSSEDSRKHTRPPDSGSATNSADHS